MVNLQFTPDLNSYFRRIGYAGPRDASAETLRELHWRHAISIPFENCDILLNKQVLLDPAHLERKIVADRRGGYCFEQNAYFAAALRALGFEVKSLIARVRCGAPAGAITPLSHMALRVRAGTREYLADVGFGGAGLTVPLELGVEGEQATPHEPGKLVYKNGDILLQSRGGDAWRDLYECSLEPVPAVDFEVANWYTSAHPQSFFVNNLIAAIPAPGLRYSLFNREFTILHADGRVEKREIADAVELLSVLSEYFHLDFSPETRFTRPEFD
ncbi:MAG: arylamine N-acetyltransferase [Planctomycetes bacterium]|nr:arylamine N-acetyltransferase [Planctomycetota bacterium]